MYLSCFLCLCTSLLKKVQLLMVAMYCNQGDNTGDAINFISQLVRILVPEEETPSECSFVFGCGVGITWFCGGY